MVHNPATATHRPRFPRSPARHPSFFSSQPISFYPAGRFVSPPALSHDSLASSTPRVDAHADARRTTRPRASHRTASSPRRRGRSTASAFLRDDAVASRNRRRARVVVVVVVARTLDSMDSRMCPKTGVAPAPRALACAMSSRA